MKKPTRRIENELFRTGCRYVAGVDEAGRGAWAGPIVAAAVILPKRCDIRGINDSKKLSPLQRSVLYEQIIDRAVAYETRIVSQRMIDAHGIQAANVIALKQSVLKLQTRPNYVLVDSFKVSWRDLPSRSIVRGDATVTAIAAASIVAKVFRDQLMVRYAVRYPYYSFQRNKGYGTAVHHRSIAAHGLCEQHRLSFEPMKTLAA